MKLSLGSLELCCEAKHEKLGKSEIPVKEGQWGQKSKIAKFCIKSV